MTGPSRISFLLAATLVLSPVIHAQAASPSALQSRIEEARPSPLSATTSPVEAQIDALAAQLAATQQRLQQSQLEIQQLQQQLLALRNQVASTPPLSPPPETHLTLADRVEMLEAQIKTHEQAKVESASRYPVHLTGMALFNAFYNRGIVDNIDFPSLASYPTDGVKTRTFGGSVRQSIIGVYATGPHLLGASSSAELNLDFAGGIPYSNYGTDSGTVRLRTGALRLHWDQDTLEAGLVEPLISPLSPSSYATVAEPAMASAGNLWIWSPQLSYEHRVSLAADSRLHLQLGLWDPPSAGYNAGALFRNPSSAERSGQPAYESRIAYSRNQPEASNALQFGVGAYYGRQSYTARDIGSWAVTGDWKVPIGHVLQLSGELYRGRAIAGLGGGVYKDIIPGSDRLTGAATFRPLDAVGGWAQLKLRFTSSLETNAAFGEDNGFARDFRSLILPATAGATALRARNQMFLANLIYSPRTYLVVSPEYRHLLTSPITGEAATANLFTTSFAVRF